ncbi:MAG: PilZ domain-containing protein [Alphaproteobacteria bacterium]|nr:PilZ domain-containing protein [Alphaproteobacteria bacterium]
MPRIIPTGRRRDRRRDRRVTSPMTVVIGSTPYAIGDWSLGGLRVLDYIGSLTAGESTPMRVFVPTAGPGALFKANAHVRRLDKTSADLGLAFESLDSIAFDTLSRYFRERLVRGQA